MLQPIHGGDLAGSRSRYPGRTFLDFSVNVNPLGMPEGVRAAYLACLQECGAYPDPLCRELLRALSRFEGIGEDRILCGCGAADLIYRAAFALRPRKALVLAPTFAEYELALMQAGCGVQRFPLREEEDFLPGKALVEEVRDKDLAILCNPNNPTGRLMPRELLESVADACRESGTTLLLDECFLDFLPEPDAFSLKHRLGRDHRLIVLRAFTKIFAMPGLRLGYALFSDSGLLRKCRDAGPPWAVSAPAQACGIAATRESKYLARTRECVPLWREELSAGLRDCGCRVFPSDANFLLFRHPRADLFARLEERGVLIRDCADFYGLGPGYYRAGVRAPEENRKLIEAVKGL